MAGILAIGAIAMLFVFVMGSASATFTMRGSVAGNCSKLRIWGGQVTVYNDVGRIVGAGSLINEGTAVQGCLYGFTVANVPSSSNTYGIEIGRLGRINIASSQARYPSLTVN